MNAKQTVKRILAEIWDLRARISPTRPKLTILYYHAVPPGAVASFDAQMAYLRRHANIVRPDHDGPLDPGRPNVAVTFDDAFRSVREGALPALIRHQIPATIFAPTGWLGRPPGWAMETDGDRAEIVMDADELAALPRDLISFGSHTVNHPRLTYLPDAEIDAELARSRSALEELLGAPIDTLAFPYGDHDARVLIRAAAAGYRRVYTVQPQAIQAGDDALSRGRTSVDAADSLGLFALKTRGAFDWMPMASKAKRMLRGR